MKLKEMPLDSGIKYEMLQPDIKEFFEYMGIAKTDENAQKYHNHGEKQWEKWRKFLKKEMNQWLEEL